MSRPPLPPFSETTAAQKVRAAEDGWNSCSPQLVTQAYTEDSKWRNRSKFLTGYAEIEAFRDTTAPGVSDSRPNNGQVHLRKTRGKARRRLERPCKAQSKPKGDPGRFPMPKHKSQDRMRRPQTARTPIDLVSLERECRRSAQAWPQ